MSTVQTGFRMTNRHHNSLLGNVCIISPINFSYSVLWQQVFSQPCSSRLALKANNYVAPTAKRVLRVLIILMLASWSMHVWSGVPDAPPPDTKPQVPANQTPPATDREINSIYSGLWFDPSRNGEGFALVVSETTAGPTVVVSYYTYDNQKQSVFLVGSKPLPAGATSVSIPVVITSGANFGDAFKPADVVRTPAGTLTFAFSSCNAGTVDYDLTTLGSGNLSIVRLLGVESLDCN